MFWVGRSGALTHLMKRFHGASICLQIKRPTPPKPSAEQEPSPFTEPTGPVVMRDKKKKEGVMNAPHITLQSISEVAGLVFAIFADGCEPLNPADFPEPETEECITLVPPTSRELYHAEAA